MDETDKKMRTNDGIMYEQTGASHWSVSQSKVSELECGILPIEIEGMGN